MFYSKITTGFYPADLRSDYEKAGAWPVDAVEITDELHAELMAAQAAGLTIQAGPDGLPVATDRQAPTPAQLASVARVTRGALLTASDWTQTRDMADAVASKWAPYRQALRDVTKQAGFPESIDWPVSP